MSDLLVQVRKVELLREVFIPTPLTDDIQSRIARLHRRENSASEGGVLTLFGETRSGKTKLLSDYAARFPVIPNGIQKPNGDFADRKEVVMFEVPDGNLINFYREFYAKLVGLSVQEVKGLGTRHDFEESCYDLIEEEGVKLVMLQETHNAFDSKKDKVVRDFARKLKDLLNRARCSLVISGTAEAKRVVEASSELDGRVLYDYEIPPYSWDDLASRRTFLEVIGGLDEYLSEDVFGRLSNLTDVAIALPLLQASLGYVGHAAALIEGAGVLALERGCGRILLEHITDAFATSRLRHQFSAKDRPSPFGVMGPASADDGLDHNVTRLRGRTRISNRDVEFKR